MLVNNTYIESTKKSGGPYKTQPDRPQNDSRWHRHELARLSSARPLDFLVLSY